LVLSQGYLDHRFFSEEISTLLKTMFGSSLHPVGCRRVQSCLEHLLYMCLFAYRGVQHILCGVVFFLFVYLMFCCCFVCLRIVYPMLPVSLDCLSSSCVPNVASLSGLFVFVLCTQCCQSLWIVCLRLVYPMLPVSLDCPFGFL
jgi:hypothetical protein